MTAGRLFVGTSGFAYKEWIGAFYPEGTRSTGMLSYYASCFGSVEINYTFRRHPAETTLANWRAQTPDGFVFAPKANQGITHTARLVGAAERLERYARAIAPLGDRLGPTLFQCPPNLAYDPEVLAGFLDDLARRVPGTQGWRFAMEFRHPSFHCDEARAQLAAAGVALCVADTEDPGDNAGRPDLVCTADFAYLRLRRGGYDEAALGSWGEAIGAVLAGGTDVFAFFKHEDSATGPRHAAVLMGASSSPGATSRPARPRP